MGDSVMGLAKRHQPGETLKEFYMIFSGRGVLVSRPAPIKTSLRIKLRSAPVGKETKRGQENL